MQMAEISDIEEPTAAGTGAIMLAVSTMVVENRGFQLRDLPRYGVDNLTYTLFDSGHIAAKAAPRGRQAGSLSPVSNSCCIWLITIYFCIANVIS
jgi:hypothetical protein